MAGVLTESLNDSSQSFEEISVDNFEKFYDLFVSKELRVNTQVSNFNIQKSFGSATAIRTPVEFEVSFDTIKVMEDL